MTLKIARVDRQSKHFPCLKTPRTSLAAGIMADTGFSFYSGDIDELVIFKCVMDRPDILIVLANDDLWARFKNLHTEEEVRSTFDIMKAQLEAAVDADSLWIIFNLVGEIVATNAQVIAGASNSQEWVWVDRESDIGLARALEHLRCNYTLLIDTFLGGTQQVWYEFKYHIIYAACGGYIQLLKCINSEYDFWIQLAACFPKLYKACRGYTHWEINDEIRDAFIRAMREL